MQGINFKVDYISKLPLRGDSPKVSIFGDETIDETFTILFIDEPKKEIVFTATTTINNVVVGARQWFTEWLIQVYNSKGELIFDEKFEPALKKIMIKIDGRALGDNIAWMPYIEEFRKKHNCDIICSTFFNDLFSSQYPEIIFVPPNTEASNIYAQYYIGASDILNPTYCPVMSKNVPLQYIAAVSLGLEYKEIKPKVGYHDLPNQDYGSRYVCLSEFGSSSNKSWKYENGWQLLVNFLNAIEYKVVVISKEPTNLKNVINKTGDIPLSDRISDLEHADFFIGISSGLAWLSWAVGTHVVMISDVTPSWHEFHSGITRIIHEEKQMVDYSDTTPSSIFEVILKLQGIF